MEFFITCNEPQFASTIRAGLQLAGRECSHSHVVSHESALACVSTLSDRQSIVLFYASRNFTTEDYSRLKQLCGACRSTVKVVAVASQFDPASILQAVRCGAVDGLDVSADFDDDLKSLLDRLRSAAMESEPAGKLVAVVGAVGGVGASLLATNLSAALALREGACGLLDLQLHGGDLATLLKTSPRHTLLSLAGKGDQIDQAMFEQSLIHHESGIHLLASPEPFADYRQIRPQVVKRVVELARRADRNVVVDAEDCDQFAQVFSLSESDRIVVPLRLDFVALCRTKKCIEHLLQSDVPRSIIIVVATRTGRAKELPIKRAEEVLEMSIAFQIPEDSLAINTSLNLGVPFVMGSPKSKVSLSVDRLLESLNCLDSKLVEPLEKARRLLDLKSAASLFGVLS